VAQSKKKKKAQTKQKKEKKKKHAKTEQVVNIKHAKRKAEAPNVTVKAQKVGDATTTAKIKVVSKNSQFQEGRKFIEGLKARLQSAISENTQSDKFDGVRKCVYKLGSDFSGLGTDHIALARAGITTSQCWASEKDGPTRKLLRATIGQRVKIFRDVAVREISELPDSVDLYVAGPSCPPWSGIGTKTSIACYSLANAT
jgi:hypothetical protein